jgi:hypothetical protein
MSEEQKYQADYQKGFNEGYIIAKHLPTLSDGLAKVESAAPRIEGIHDGRKQFVLEQTKEHRPSWMKSDGHKKTDIDTPKNKDKEPER